MATGWTTEIQMVAIRVGGEIDFRIDLADVGSRAATAAVMTGNHLIRVTGRRPAERVAAIWREAALHLVRIPEQVSKPRKVHPDFECPAGLVISIGPDAPVRQDYIPAVPAAAGRPGRMAHLRIQVGPLVWLVTDRAAYTSMRRMWERLESLL